ncbi:MAG: DUF5522 domain-containing protein [Bdellovibrionota bacterium]
MEKELSYVTADGFTVFTSQFLKNRGTCCKSACLHCPFGYTLKKLGLQFREAVPGDEAKISEIIEASGAQGPDLKSFMPNNVQFMELKGTVCGVMMKNHIVVKHVFLLPHFTNQGLNKDIIESYFFI